MATQDEAIKTYEILGVSIPLPQINAESQTKERILMESTLLFAKQGFAAVSMRDIAEVIGIKPASLYNHFESKQVLWDAVLEHAKHLYLIYFDQMDKELQKANSFAEILEIIFQEPIRLTNVFTCYAFSMVQAEQFRDAKAAEIFNSIFLEYSIDFFKRHFDTAIENGFVQPFDTEMVATTTMHSVLVGLECKVQEYLERKTAYDPSIMFAKLRNHLHRTLGTPSKCEPTAVQAGEPVQQP